MRTLITISFFLLTQSYLYSQNIGIGTNTPDASAILDMESITQGLLIPRMTTVQRLAIVSPAEGLMVFDTSKGSFYFFDNNTWFNISKPLLLSDQDNDTKVEVEKTSDEDRIHFKVKGYTLMSMHRDSFGKSRIEYFNSKGNIFIGEESGMANTFGNNNTFLGKFAGRANTQGDANTFLGHDAGMDITTGLSNTFIGSDSGYSTSPTASYNTAVGHWSGSKVEGSRNTFIGHRSGNLSLAVNENTNLGAHSGEYNYTGNNNTYLGYKAGRWNYDGSDNVMLGDSAGWLVLGDGNVFIGKRAAKQGGETTINNRLYIHNAGGNNPLIYGEFDNEFITINGQLALGTKVPGPYEFSIFDRDGDGDVFFRMFTTSADQNDVLMGFNDASNAFFLRTVSNHPIRFQTNGASTKMIIEAAGDVGIGTTNPTHKLHVNGVARSTQSTWATSSDKRVKQNIKEVESALSIVNKLRPVTFEWIDEYKKTNEGLDSFNYGFIAQDVETIIPEMVSVQKETIGDKVIEDFRTLNVGPLFPILVKAVQEQQKDIQQLKEQNQMLMEKIEKLIGLYAQLGQSKKTNDLSNLRP